MSVSLRIYSPKHVYCVEMPRSETPSRLNPARAESPSCLVHLAGLVPRNLRRTNAQELLRMIRLV